MKNKNKLKMMDGIEDELIERANPDNIKPKKKRRFSARMGMIAACLVIAVVAVNLAIFLPSGTGEPPIITPDSGGPSTKPNADKPLTIPGTYDEIKALLDANLGYDYEGGVDADDSLNGGTGMDTPSMGVPDSDIAPELGGSSSYVEVTDNQVEGVIEADIFKRTTTHIFYLRGNKLYAYSIKGEDSALVGEIEFTKNQFSAKEMYLSQDGRVATIIYSTISNRQNETSIITVNVENPAEMTAAKCTSIKGSYISSRYTNGELLLFTRFYVSNTSSTSNYIPSVDLGDGYQLLPPESILAPTQINSCSYLTISKLSGENLSYGGSTALLSYGSTTYVSSESVYATRSYYHTQTVNNVRSYGYKTEIARIDYSGNALKTVGTVSINGAVKDQYCMDEHNGVLRVFTTIQDGYYTVSGNTSNGVIESGGTVSSDVIEVAPTEPDTAVPNEGIASDSTEWTESSVSDSWAESSIDMIEPQGNDVPVASPMSLTARRTYGSVTSASLYCIDIEKMVVVASVKEFAPQGETVQSARFDGNTAYVCTAIVFTDPVFVFDLSDLENITYKDTGVIEGYSHSLIELEGGYLLGIGQTGWSTIKLELYLETENGLVSVSKVELEDAYGTSDYKAHYVNREEMIFGFAYQQYSPKYKTVYHVFKIVNGEIVTAAEIDIHEKSVFSLCRGVYVDGYFYVLSDVERDCFYFEKLD